MLTVIPFIAATNQTVFKLLRKIFKIPDMKLFQFEGISILCLLAKSRNGANSMNVGGLFVNKRKSSNLFIQLGHASPLYSVPN